MILIVSVIRRFLVKDAVAHRVRFIGRSIPRSVWEVGVTLSLAALFHRVW